MKKIILALSITALAISCKKLPEGGNKGVLKLEEGVERYTDDVQSSSNVQPSSEIDSTAHNHHSEIVEEETH